jgi:HlyD family secretion protein
MAAAGAVVYGFWREAVAVDTGRIGRGDVIVTAEDEGVARVREVYLVSSPVAGTVQRSPVEIGDAVRKGDSVVAAILPATPGFLDERAMQMAEAELRAAEAALALANANLESASAQADFWRKQLARIEKLRVGATVSERTVDETQMETSARIAAEQSAKAEVELRVREVERAKAALLAPNSAYMAGAGRCCLKVMAPEDGVVLKIQTESEAVIPAGAPLLEIGDPRSLEAVAEFLSRDAVRVRPGARATIEGWGGEPLNARVRQIDKAGFTKVSALGIEEQRVKVWLDLTGPPAQWERLGHEYRVIVKVAIEEVRDALRAPVSALFRHADRWAVFVRRDGRARLTPLKIGAKNFEWTEVLDGLRVHPRSYFFLTKLSEHETN